MNLFDYIRGNGHRNSLDVIIKLSGILVDVFWKDFEFLEINGVKKIQIKITKIAKIMKYFLQSILNKLSI
jgi:hypothetical protein